MSKKVVIFDLDGTILDTIGDITAAVNRALDFYGYGARTVEEITSFLGNGSLMLIRRALPGGGSDEFCIEVRTRFRAEYEAHMYDLTAPYEGAVELLRELASMGIKTAVVTNKDDRAAVPMIKHYFGDTVSICRGVRADTDRKPSPDITLSVLESFGCTPEEALFIGDGMADLTVAKKCGIDYIPVGYGYTSGERLFNECGITPVNSVSDLRDEIMRQIKNI